MIEHVPRPILRQRSSRPVLTGRLLMAGLGAVAVLAVAFAAWTTLRPVHDPALTAAAQAARQEAFHRAPAAVLVAIQPHELRDAIIAMKLKPEEQRAMESAVAAGRVDLVWLTLWDDQAEDGDIVSVESESFMQSVRLANAPTRVAVPRPKGGTVTVRGVHDGGGGITVAAATDQAPVQVPVLAVGQTILLPVR